MVETHGANFEASDVLRMFPTFVWKAQVAPSVRQEIEDWSSPKELVHRYSYENGGSEMAATAHLPRKPSF